MGILGWIIIGIVAGWIAEQVTKSNMGVLMNLVVGVVGAFVGGFLFSLVGGSGVTGFNVWSLVVATVGAIALLYVVSFVRKKAA
jgi:uncharacterized membrane protein YeaQ/YmgE (transglycosylase-associated protein family)